MSHQNGKNSSFIKQQKEQALSIFSKLGFPTPANEEWKYTNLNSILKKEYLVSSFQNIDQNEIDKFLITDLIANNLFIINGKFVKELSKIIEKDGVIDINDFSDLTNENLESYYKECNCNDDAFNSLNLAFAEHGCSIKINAGKNTRYPIVIYFITDKINDPIFTQPRVTILSEKNSFAQIAEYHITLGSNDSFTNCYTDIVLKENSQLEYYKIQLDGKESNHVGTTQVNQHGKSNFYATTITLGGAIVRNNLNIALNASYSECFLYGLYLIDGNRHVDNHSLVDHAVPNCYSNELYKGVLSEKSTGVFNGKILVREDAQKTNAFQSNKTILLSPDATMNAKPQLEIFADDVKCSHGATIGQLNEEALFYLRSRGLSEIMAKSLLTLAFADDIIEHIKIPELKEHLKLLISQHL